MKNYEMFNNKWHSKLVLDARLEDGGVEIPTKFHVLISMPSNHFEMNSSKAIHFGFPFFCLTKTFFILPSNFCPIILDNLDFESIWTGISSCL